MGNAVPIRALLYLEGDFIVAQCLEYNIGAYARDIETLKARLDAVIDMECATSVELFGEPFKGIPPAPKRFVSRWDDGYEIEGSTDPSHFTNASLEVEVSYKLAA